MKETFPNNPAFNKFPVSVATGKVELAQYSVSGDQAFIELYVRDDRTGELVPFEFHRIIALGGGMLEAMLIGEEVDACHEITRDGSKYTSRIELSARTGMLVGTPMVHELKWEE